MADRAQVLVALYAAVDDVNLQLPAASRLVKSETTPLLGDAAHLDSLGFLNLVLAAETQVNTRCVPRVNLAERLLELDEPSLPATVGALATFILALQGS